MSSLSVTVPATLFYGGVGVALHDTKSVTNTLAYVRFSYDVI